MSNKIKHVRVPTEVLDIEDSVSDNSNDTGNKRNIQNTMEETKEESIHKTKVDHQQQPIIQLTTQITQNKNSTKKTHEKHKSVNSQESRAVTNLSPQQTHHGFHQLPQNDEHNYPFDSELIGKRIKLKIIKDDPTNDTITYEIKSITSKIDDPPLHNIVTESTNGWLFLKGYKCENNEENKTRCTNLIIAIIVILLQILAYFTLSFYLISSTHEEEKFREETCYGPNCYKDETHCMHISTGGVMAILLVGFLWADMINTTSMIIDSFNGIKLVNKTQLIASIAILFELCSAMICGILVGLYTQSEFDAINGAVGILFVHDLDEKIFDAMDVIGDKKNNVCHNICDCICNIRRKKILAVILWIVVAMIIAIPYACMYTNHSFFAGNNCAKGEFNCGGGECIWEGFVCNGVEDCSGGHDERQYCDFSLVTCPHDMFRCESTGSCIDMIKQCDGVTDCKDGSDELFVVALNANDSFRCVSDGLCIAESKRCDGVLDCNDGSDEGRDQNCSAKIADITCGDPDIISSFEYKYPDDVYHLKVSNGSMFKCNNGQCIDGKYLCDGVSDCIDASDEYPIFYKPNEFPFAKSCPYDRLIECNNDDVLCKLSGKCITKVRICDGTHDCPDGADERMCPTPEICNVNENFFNPVFQCGSQIAKINTTHIVLTDRSSFRLIYPVYNDQNKLVKIDLDYTDGYPPYLIRIVLDPFIDVYNLTTLAFEHLDQTDVITQAMHFAGTLYISSNYKNINNDVGCLPIEYRCDGVVDCGDSSDEMMCDLFGCNDDEYQCEFGKCIPNDWVCDGVCDCLPGSDQGGTAYCEDDEKSFYNYTTEETTNVYGEECAGRMVKLGIPIESGSIYRTVYDGCNYPVSRSIEPGGAQRLHYVFEVSCNYSNVWMTTCHENVTDFRTSMTVQGGWASPLTQSSHPSVCYDGVGNNILWNMTEFCRGPMHAMDNYVIFRVQIEAVYVKEAFGKVRFVALCS
eukprot:486670_1